VLASSRLSQVTRDGSRLAATAAALTAPHLDSIPARFEPVADQALVPSRDPGSNDSPVREKCFSDFPFCVWCVQCGKNKSG